MTKRTKKRLTASEFKALEPLLKNISEDRRKAAYAVLVDGITMQAAAIPYGWSRQAVFDCVKQVWKAFLEYRDAQSIEAQEGLLLPAGWEKVTLIAPTALISHFREEIAKASKQQSADIEAPAKKSIVKKPAKKA